MKKTICIIAILISMYLTGCKNNAPEPSAPGATGYVVKPQRDIPWNSLAKTNWPKALKDAQCTGRSSFVGPTQGKVKITVPLDQYTTDPVMGSDSVFYIVSDTNLCAITLNGTRLWNRVISNGNGNSNYNSPMVTADGNIIVGRQYGISAFRNDGTPLWTTVLDGAVLIKSCGIDLNGNIYAVTNLGTLYAIGKSGNILWQKKAPSGIFNDFAGLSFSPDGSRLYVGGKTAGQSLYVLDTDGNVLRVDSLGGAQHGAISVDVEGNVFTFIGNDIVSISSTGKTRWRINPAGYWNVVIDPFGNIAYLANGRLFLVDNNGLRRWDIPVGQADFYTHLVCDAVGTIFIETSYDGKTYDVQAVSNSGAILWTVSVAAYVKNAGPSLTRDGYLLFPHSNYYPWPKKLYVIE